MTTRELRQILTAVENQNMSVKELRDLLFNEEDQDKEINETDIMKMTYNK